MDQQALDQLWRHLHEGLTSASRSPAYERFPSLARRAKREAEQFAALPPPRSEDELNLRRLTATGMMSSWGADFVQGCIEQ